MTDANRQIRITPLRLLCLLAVIFAQVLPLSAQTGTTFTFSYPSKEEIPYKLGYQYSVYDLKESPEEGWREMYLEAPVTLTYNITDEAARTVEVVFDPSYMLMEDVVIPETVTHAGKTYTVTAIGKMAFDDCPNIRSVIMGNSITRIEDYAFNMCENKILHSIGFIKFSENLTHIGNYAFRNCHNLTTGYFTEGNQLKLLPNTALVGSVDTPFYGYAARLTGLDDYLLLPASVEYIGKHAFEGCYFEREDNHLNYGLCKVKIPNPSCVIDDYAFAGCKFLELVTIGEELTYQGLTYPEPNTTKKGRIGNHAFADCNLMRLDIPSSIESIGEFAFSNCFHRSTDRTPRTNEGRVYQDELNWFYPRSLFHNWDSSWASWNSAKADDLKYDQNDNPDDLYYSDFDKSLDFLPKYQKYLDKWHTNTVTIHSNKTTIASNAFANNPLLEKIIINGSAGEIGSGAFCNCFNLTEVKLPDGLTKLSNSTFMNDTVLVKINIPIAVTEIGDSAFYHCVKLETLELPSNLKKVNPYTFYGCKMLDLSTLPESVTSIGEYAFYGCRNITSFEIPDKVTTIGDYAFAECYIHDGWRVNDVYKWFYGLTKVKIGSGVTSIGAHAFDGCRHLGQIEFGESVKTIGDYAFQNCMSCPKERCEVTNSGVTLPNSLTTMGTGAFQGCTHMPEITLGEHMTTLPDFAFAYCSDLQSVGNIDNITSANKNAFLGCYSLEDFGSIFKSEDGLILGEDGIFYNLERTEIVSALPNISDADLSETKVEKIRDGAFANCGALGFISFPPTLKEIGSRAFENCTQLTEAELIDVKMGELVYAGCTGIEYVYISKDFTQDLQDNWFAGCINMQEISVEDGNIRYSSDVYKVLLLSKDGKTLLRAPSGVTELSIPESVTTIGDYAISNCIELYMVDFPESVTHIGAHAFDNCSRLPQVSFNPAVTIGSYAFNNCERLAEVYWDVDNFEPKGIGSIGAYAFNGCEDLFITDKTFNIQSAAIGTLEPYALAGLPGLEEITLPATLESIGDHAFDSCENLTSVVFPEGLKTIGRSAFKSAGLKTINLPDAIEEIGDSAFMDCSQVMALKLPASLKKINPYTFYKCFSRGQFDEKPTTDEQTTKDFDLSVVIPDGVVSIGDYAFYGCAANFNKYHSGAHSYSNMHHFYYYGLSSLTIGKSVTTIGDHAFDGCLHLFDVKMGDAVTSIGDFAFNNCFHQTFKGVRKVEYTLTGHIAVDNGKPNNTVVWYMEDTIPQPISLPEGLKKLGAGAFRGCSELPSINFPDKIGAIADSTFYGCAKLDSIILPEGIHTIGSVAFGGCTGVKKISVPASLTKASRSFVDCDLAHNVVYYAATPRTFDEAMFSPKVYSSYESVLYAPNAEILLLKQTVPWASFHTLKAKDETLVHDDKVLEEKNGLRFRVLSNKPHPFCEVAGPVEGSTSSTYTIPETVKNIDKSSDYYGQDYTVIRIGNDAFEHNLNLTGIEIPSTVYDIGQEAFNGCRNLAEINLPASIKNMGERAFADCYSLTYFEVPPLVTRLNTEVLKDCRGLLTIKMHDNITELCAGALMDCRHLRAFDRSSNWKLTLIDDYALKNCIELEHINIPEGVKKIGREAFYYCQKLTVASLPTTLEQLGERAFDNCEVLATIKVFTETPPEMIGERKLTDPECKIYVQTNHYNKFMTAWTAHANRLLPAITINNVPEAKADMPRFIPGQKQTFTTTDLLDFEGKYIWTTTHPIVKFPDTKTGTFTPIGVGITKLKVSTEMGFYHWVNMKVYPQVADANWDGEFNIADAVNIANYALLNTSVLVNSEANRKDLAAEWKDFYYEGADVNTDGIISIADASAAVKKIIAENPTGLTVSRSADGEEANGETDALVVDTRSRGAADGQSIDVRLADSREYVALQADVSVPVGAKLLDVKAGSRAAAHALTMRRVDDRTMRVVLFDLGNKAFEPTDEPLLEVVVSGQSVDPEGIMITGIVASDLSSRSYHLGQRTGAGSLTPTGIDDVDSDRTADGDTEKLSVSLTADGLTIADVAGQPVRIYTVSGVMVKSFTATSDFETVSLPKGVYIVTVNKRAAKVAVY